jgi:hypothetical protein
MWRFWKERAKALQTAPLMVARAAGACDGCLGAGQGFLGEKKPGLDVWAKALMHKRVWLLVVWA